MNRYRRWKRRRKWARTPTEQCAYDGCRVQLAPRDWIEVTEIIDLDGARADEGFGMTAYFCKAHDPRKVNA